MQICTLCVPKRATRRHVERVAAQRRAMQSGGPRPPLDIGDPLLSTTASSFVSSAMSYGGGGARERQWYERFVKRISKRRPIANNGITGSYLRDSRSSLTGRCSRRRLDRRSYYAKIQRRNSRTPNHIEFFKRAKGWEPSAGLRERRARLLRYDPARGHRLRAGRAFGRRAA